MLEGLPDVQLNRQSISILRTGVLAAFLVTSWCGYSAGQTISMPQQAGTSSTPDSSRSGILPIPEDSSTSGTWRGSLTSMSDQISTNWTVEFDGTLSPDGSISGTRKAVPQQNPANWVIWNISGSLSGNAISYQDTSIASQGASPGTSGGYCQTSGTLTTPDGGNTFSGPWTASGCNGGNINVTQVTSPSINLTRENLLSIVADAAPESGMFTLQYTSTSATGLYPSLYLIGSGSTASGTTPTSQSNPATISVTEPANPAGSNTPTAGGYTTSTLTFTASGNSTNSNFVTPLFGMSCYITTLESDYGTEPSNCESLTYNGTVYSGTVTNPGRLNGTFCRSFIEQATINGSGQTNSGDQFQYIRGVLQYVDQIETTDGTPPVAGQTLARDESLIPPDTYLVINGFGSSPLLANDTGGGINGFRIDQYEGAGEARCQNFNNSERVATCSPAISMCPAETLP